VTQPASEALICSIIFGTGTAPLWRMMSRIFALRRNKRGAAEEKRKAKGKGYGTSTQQKGKKIKRPKNKPLRCQPIKRPFYKRLKHRILKRT